MDRSVPPVARIWRRLRAGSGGTAGLTFLELMVVLVTFGLLLAFALPRLRLDGYRVNAAIRGLTASLAYAQRLSVSLQHDVVVAFDSLNNRLRVHEDRNNNGTIDPGERVRATPMGDDVVFSRAGAPALTYSTGVTGTNTFNFVRTQTAMPALVFHRDGSASENGGFYITARRGLTTGVTTWVRGAEVSRSTGRVTWYSYGTGAWVLGN